MTCVAFLFGLMLGWCAGLFAAALAFASAYTDAADPFDK